MLKTQPFTITSTGDDNGKMFLLTRMPVYSAEKWAARAFLALIEGGVEIPPEVAAGGMAALVQDETIGLILRSLLGGLGRLDWAKVEPLMDEMLDCVRIIPDPAGNPDFSRPLNKQTDDITEVPTLLKIRAALLKLNTNFSSAVGPSKSPTPTASRVAPITKMSRR